MADDMPAVTINVKGPSEIKLSIQIALDATVRQLKEKIAEQRNDVPADSCVLGIGSPGVEMKRMCGIELEELLTLPDTTPNPQAALDLHRQGT